MTYLDWIPTTVLLVFGLLGLGSTVLVLGVALIVALQNTVATLKERGGTNETPGGADTPGCQPRSSNVVYLDSWRRTG